MITAALAANFEVFFALIVILVVKIGDAINYFLRRTEHCRLRCGLNRLVDKLAVIELLLRFLAYFISLSCFTFL